MKIEKINISEITEYENNAKLHPREQIEQIKKSIQEFGNNDPIAIDENNVIIEGHGRYKALKELGFDEVEVIRLSHMSEEQKRAYILVHNKLTMNSDFDIDILQLELDDIEDIDMSDFGFEPEDDFKTTEQKVRENDYSGSLVDDFIIMPQSIFDTRQGIWQNRKREWLDLGIKSEVGREGNLTFAKSMNTASLGGTSIFDPVLCEIGYTWFTPHEGSKIIDPFAGGSVRGIVAERLGHEYTGIDLREEQIDANFDNAREIGIDLDKVNWICDDSKNVDRYIQDESADLIFKKFAKKLKNNRFAIVTISDVRDKKGFYRDLTGVTKRAFESAGVMFYNDIVLINVLGSGAMRARKQMNSGRKVIRSHQSVLVFFKGDPKTIKHEFGDLAALENLEDDEENEE